MGKESAGVLLYRRSADSIEVFLVHPGGPFWAKKNLGAWTIPKGEFVAPEDPLSAALREFTEETGFHLEQMAHGGVRALGTVRQSSGKLVYAFAVEGNCDPAAVRSNTFDLEWPPRSGRVIAVPEIDRAAWFTMRAAKQHLHPAQVAFLSRLLEELELDAQALE